jgi:hypothetical protein
MEKYEPTHINITSSPQKGEREEDDRGDHSRSIPTLIKDLTQETTALVRGEIKLAKAEMNEKINEAKVGVISVASGSAIVLAGILVLLFAAVAALDLFWSLWFSALVVGAVTTVIGLLALGKGRSNLRIENLKPQRTLDEIRANK